MALRNAGIQKSNMRINTPPTIMVLTLNWEFHFLIRITIEIILITREGIPQRSIIGIPTKSRDL
jgi:hypothetical protein